MSLHNQITEAVALLSKETGGGTPYIRIEIWDDGSGRLSYISKDKVLAEYPFDDADNLTVDTALELLAPSVPPARAFLDTYAVPED